MGDFFTTPMTSILLCIVAYLVGVFIQRKTNISALHPLVLAIAIIIVVLYLLNIPITTFQAHTEVIHMLVGPATVVLAIPMYSQRKVLMENIGPILVSTGVGAVVAVVSIVGLSHLVGLDDLLIRTLIPKSVTVPIALGLAETLGGIQAITVAAVIITGISGIVLAPAFIKLFNLKEEIAIGLAIGTASHGLGTTKAVALGEVQGAMSGLAIGTTGIFTVILTLFV